MLTSVGLMFFASFFLFSLYDMDVFLGGEVDVLVHTELLVRGMHIFRFCFLYVVRFVPRS